MLESDPRGMGVTVYQGGLPRGACGLTIEASCQRLRCPLRAVCARSIRAYRDFWKRNVVSIYNLARAGAWRVTPELVLLRGSRAALIGPRQSLPAGGRATTEARLLLGLGRSPQASIAGRLAAGPTGLPQAPKASRVQQIQQAVHSGSFVTAEECTILRPCVASRRNQPARAAAWNFCPRMQARTALTPLGGGRSGGPGQAPVAGAGSD